MLTEHWLFDNVVALSNTGAAGHPPASLASHTAPAPGAMLCATVQLPCESRPVFPPALAASAYSLLAPLKPARNAKSKLTARLFPEAETLE
jgi:hypothetical protein